MQYASSQQVKIFPKQKCLSTLTSSKTLGVQFGSCQTPNSHDLTQSKKKIELGLVWFRINLDLGINLKFNAQCGGQTTKIFAQEHFWYQSNSNNVMANCTQVETLQFDMMFDGVFLCFIRVGIIEFGFTRLQFKSGLV